ncbi:MAG TPA: S8 family serine peptidase [Longimicrobiaceae bacterium]
MKRILLTTACALALAACRDSGPTMLPGAPEGAARTVAGAPLIAPDLAAALATAAPADPLLVIVNYDASRTSTTAISRAVRALGVGVVEFRHLSMLLALGTPAEIRAVAGLPGVEGVYANRTQKLLLREAVQSIKADQAWAAGYTGKGVGIAILDSGVNGLNPDVAHPTKMVQNVKFTASFGYFTEDTTALPRLGGDLFVENVPNTDLTSGHGTHVAGIAAGSGASTGGAYRGVAHGAHLVGLSAGEGLSIVYASILQAVDWMIENRAKYNIQVVNNSWGDTGDFDPTDPVVEAMKTVYDAGITVVFAAGNEGPGENTLNPKSVAPWVISVAAGCKIGVLDPTNSASQCNDGRSRALADFSSRGRPGDALYHPDVMAPGVLIVSTRAFTGAVPLLGASSDVGSCNIGIQNLPNYTCMSGTSMSAPAVAGVVALMEEAAGGKLTPDQALAILTSTARPLAGYGEWEVGAGHVDALAAVRAARRLR